MLSITIFMTSAPFAGRRLVIVSCRLLSPKCCSSSSLINVFIRELSHNLYSKCQSSTTVALKLLSNMQSWQIPAWNTHTVKEETVSQPCKASQISKQKPLWDMWKGDTNDGRKNSLLEKYDGSDEKDWLHRKPILHYWSGNFVKGLSGIARNGLQAVRNVKKTVKKQITTDLSERSFNSVDFGVTWVHHVCFCAVDHQHAGE